MNRHPHHQSIAPFIRGLRFFFFGPSLCLYPIGCIDFVTDQFLTQPFFNALKNSINRIISCNPLFSK